MQGNNEVKGVFLGNLKRFENLWHDGALFKLTQNRMSENLLNLMRHFLSERRQHIVLNGEVFIWTNVTAEVPQGSTLGPLLILIYINDLSDGPSTNAKLLVNDSFLFSNMYDSQTCANDPN